MQVSIWETNRRVYIYQVGGVKDENMSAVYSLKNSPKFLKIKQANQQHRHSKTRIVHETTQHRIFSYNYQKKKTLLDYILSYETLKCCSKESLLCLNLMESIWYIYFTIASRSSKKVTMTI